MSTVLNTSQEAIQQNEETRSGTSVHALKKSIVDNLLYRQGRFPEAATNMDWYLALAYSVRDRLLKRWLHSEQTYKNKESRTVCYLSAEFLIGPQLGSNLINMGIWDNVHAAVLELGLDLNQLIEMEEEPGLGNGGLGRLAACYLDSLASQKIPAIGYGLYYEFGIFNQSIVDGWQVEKTDKWLINGNPWALHRHKITFDIKFGGRLEQYSNENGQMRVRWLPDRHVKGVAYDTPIVGYGVNNANLLRLWKAEAPEAFDLNAFNQGNHFGAVTQKMAAENLTKVLYPNDQFQNGKRLRLEQQYFLVSCSLQDMLRIYLDTHQDLRCFQKKYAAQLNDTHPALAIPELMRLLIDEHALSWEEAWQITTQTFSYTNHTLLPEAIETWSVALLQELLPRHLEIIFEINQRFLDEVRVHYRGHEHAVENLSIIGEDKDKYVRMANLSCVGSHTINGVASLHTRLLKEGMLKDFDTLWPEKITNITNGITPRRFIRLANPGLSQLISHAIGDDWVSDLNHLQELEKFANDSAFLDEWAKVKLQAKQNLATLIYTRSNTLIDPQSLFSIQAKRIHEYKRQHLNLLHILTLYNRIKDNPDNETVPRTFIFSGKAAPGYNMAKLIIKLINSVATVIDQDPVIKNRLKIFFLPNFNVKNAQTFYPAADLSEQISTAGKEASGTGNMKLSLNGALTIGTLDGANVEIRDAVGHENFFLFGHSSEKIDQLKAQGYDPRHYYEQDDELRAAIDLINSGIFSHGDHSLFHPLTASLLNSDPFMLMADYRSYVDCQFDLAESYLNKTHWNRMSLLNVARMGTFSSDRAVHEYCERVWRVQPVTVEI
jgi:starch phosphorylase